MKTMETAITSILYFFGLAPNPIEKTETTTDYNAIKDDWSRIGMDIYKAMSKYEAEQDKH